MPLSPNQKKLKRLYRDQIKKEGSVLKQTKKQLTKAVTKTTGYLGGTTKAILKRKKKLAQ